MSPNETRAIDQLRHVIQAQTAATLAAALVAASGKPHSIQQTIDLARDIQFAMYPAPGLSTYEEWEKTKWERLHKIQGL